MEYGIERSWCEETCKILGYIMAHSNVATVAIVAIGHLFLTSDGGRRLNIAGWSRGQINLVKSEGNKIYSNRIVHGRDQARTRRNRQDGAPRGDRVRYNDPGDSGSISNVSFEIIQIIFRAHGLARYCLWDRVVEQSSRVDTSVKPRLDSPFSWQCAKMPDLRGEEPSLR